MQVILLERIGKLGQMGDVVKVKDGFARNFLLPQGKALRATEANMKRFERDRAQLEADNLERKTEAEAVAEKLQGQSFVAIRQAGDNGQLYGSVTTRDVAMLVTEGGFTIQRRQIALDHAIKMLGVHAIQINLHPEVAVSVEVNVARTEDEAVRQARGEDVTALTDEDEYAEDDEALSAEEVFEDAQQAEEVEAELEADQIVEEVVEEFATTAQPPTETGEETAPEVAEAEDDTDESDEETSKNA